MTVTLGILLDDRNARQRRPPDPRVTVVLLERTLHEPPRKAAARRWAEPVRRSFPQAELIPFAWHLVSHGVDDGMRRAGTRTLPGDPAAFGELRATPAVEQAWEVTGLCAEGLGAQRIAIRTPASITPGPLGRKRIAAFAAAHPRAKLWEPQGLWEPTEAALLASQVGWTALIPGFHAGRPTAGAAGAALVPPGMWIRVDGYGPRADVGPEQMELLAEHADAVPDAAIVFAGPRARTHLGRFAKMIEIGL